MTTALTRRVLSVWFGDAAAASPSALLAAEYAVPGELGARWYKSTPEFDGELRSEFAEEMKRARAGTYDHLRHTAADNLALIVLLDQFTRNAYRGQADAFAFDAKALQLAEYGAAHGHHLMLAPSVAAFVLMPFMHSEDVATGRRGLALFSALAARTPGKPSGTLAYGEKHLAIVERFGRYPHRNAALGRESSAEELAYLKDAERFGQ